MRTDVNYTKVVDELESLRAENESLRERVESFETVYPFHQWHDDDGPVLWYLLPVCEPAFHVGTPSDSDWPWDGDTPESKIGWARIPNPCRGVAQEKPAENGAGGA